MSLLERQFGRQLLQIPVSVSLRKHCLLFSTKNPSTIQRMPWPMDEDAVRPEQAAPVGYDTWIVNDEDFAWMVEPDGMIIQSLPLEAMLDAYSQSPSST